jgi:preprotein translocase YajC subunit
MGTLILAAPPAKTTGGGSTFLLIILVFAAMMVFLVRSQRKRQRAAMDTQRQVVDGSRIRTTFGLYGTVVSGDDRNVMVEIAPGVQVKLLRQAIAAVVPDDEPDGVRQTVPDMPGDEASDKHDNRSDLSI